MKMCAWRLNVVLLGLSCWLASSGLHAATPQETAHSLKKVADEALQSQQAVRKKLDAAQAQGKPFQDAIVKARTEAAKATAALRTAEKDLPAKVEAVKKDDRPRCVEDGPGDCPQGLENANAAVAAAKSPATEKAAADAAANLKTTEMKLAAAEKAVADATADQKKTETIVSDSKALIAKTPELVKQAEAELAKLKPALDAAQAEFAKATADLTAKSQQAEAALSGVGEFVYFSKQIAPIFAKRCLACHNARTAKGRYNMETYAGVMKGGEQGETVIPKEPDTSNIVALIEDGSMPQDADPLTKDEIALIRKWVQLGAVLDAGINSEAALTSILPKLPQPPAPEKYRVTVPITALAFSADGKEVASSGYHEVLIWNAADGKLVRRITNVAERPQEIQYSPDGKLIAVAAGTPGQYGELKIFDAATGALSQDLLTSGDTVFCVAFSPDGKKIACGGADRAIRIIDLATGKVERTIEDHADWVLGITWSPDGAKLASASRDKTSKIFDVKTGESLVTFSAHAEPVYGVSFSLDGTQVFTSGRDKQIRIWNVANAQQAKVIGGFGNEVYRIVLTKDGKLFSASADQIAREHKTDGAEVRKYPGHKDWIYGIAVNPSTGKLATGSWDGEIRIWNIADGKELVHFIAAPGLAPTAQAAK
ncbi:MAG: c-type cytochrome domain-containing protein [Planctomycetales bacterium]